MNTIIHRGMALVVAFVLLLCAANPTLSAGAQAGVLSKQAASSQLPSVHMPKVNCPPDYYYCDSMGIKDPLIASGNLVYFIADDGIHGRELWVSDGTNAGTHMVKDLHPGYEGFPYDPYPSLEEQPFGDHSLVFPIQSTDSSNGLYRTDGTEAGTIRLGDAGTSYNPVDFVGGFLYLLNDQYLILDGNPLTLRAVDINNGSTSLLAELNNNCFVAKMVIGGWLYVITKNFSDSYSANPYHVATTSIWKTDGTPAGTTLVKEIGPTGFPSSLASLAGSLYFIDSGDFMASSNTVNLWRSDGTPDGTFIAKSFSDQGLGPIHFLSATNESVVFCVEGPTDAGLWQSDGTTAGTVQVTQACWGGYQIPFKNKVYFYSGEGWYKPDSNAAGGVVKVLGRAPFDDPDPDNANASIATIYYSANGLLYLQGDSGSGHNVWWVTDGTSLTALSGSQGYLAPDDPSAVGSKLFFSAWDAEAGNELWMSDGTPAGTSRLADLKANDDPNTTKSSLPKNLTSIGNHVFFTADDGIHGRQLWVADLTMTTKIFIPMAMR